MRYCPCGNVSGSLGCCCGSPPFRSARRRRAERFREPCATRTAFCLAPTVKITNTGTNVSQQLVTNASGYFEAPLLIAGDYEVSVEIAELQELPADRHSARGWPVRSADHHPGGRQRERTRGRGRGCRAPRHQCGLVGSHLREPPACGAADVLEHAAAPDSQRLGRGGERGSAICDPGLRRRPIGAGGPDRRRRRHGYTIDGATNAGNARNIATSPNSDMLQEMRIETANFDASVGHGTGLGVAMMTKAGTNRLSGLAALPGVDESPERSEPLSEADSRARPRVEESLPIRQVDQHVVHPRRSDRDPEAGGRTEQVVLLRQLLVRRRSHPG